MKVKDINEFINESAEVEAINESRRDHTKTLNNFLTQQGIDSRSASIYAESIIGMFPLDVVMDREYLRDELTDIIEALNKLANKL